jgi:AcrR family transcriptional regulator
MAATARRARQKAMLRREILDAARELFAREGYENVSMRKIAHKIDYSPTTIYLYFQDKFELLRGICEETFGKLVAQFNEIERTTSDPVERLKQAGRAYIEFGLKYPNHYKVTFISAPEPQDVNQNRHQGSAGETCFSHLRAMVEDCIKQKRFRDIDVDTASQTLWAATHGLTSLLIAHPAFPWVQQDKLIDHLLDLITRGLVIPESQAKESDTA